MTLYETSKGKTNRSIVMIYVHNKITTIKAKKKPQEHITLNFKSDGVLLWIFNFFFFANGYFLFNFL